ncbi:MAG: cohesin domain-containing protein, partial [Candidatus Methanoperedens sp.]|nr:cohesin domain-containing protein [Candidatus Methanoperedens sp.]
MKMIYKALFSIIILVGFYSNCFSQATLSIGTANGTPGNSISIPIQATGIVDMTGFQFTIEYDKTKLTYISCTNWITGLNATQVQINPLDGKLT